MNTVISSNVNNQFQNSFIKPQENEEFMWIVNDDEDRCNGICQNGEQCKNKKLARGLCYQHKDQNIAYLTS